MSSEPDDVVDPDSDPEMLASAGVGGGEGPVDTTPGIDGVREASSVAEDPLGQDDSDADPVMLSSSS